MTNEKLAAELIKNLGGAENILSATNCMTRLRVQTADKDKIAVDAIKKLAEVSGVYDAGAEFQIILNIFIPPRFLIYDNLRGTFVKVAGILFWNLNF